MFFNERGGSNDLPLSILTSTSASSLWNRGFCALYCALTESPGPPACYIFPPGFPLPQPCTYRTRKDIVPNLPASDTWPLFPQYSGFAAPIPFFPLRLAVGSPSAAAQNNWRGLSIALARARPPPSVSTATECTESLPLSWNPHSGRFPRS